MVLRLDIDEASSGGEFPRGRLEITSALFEAHKWTRADGTEVRSNFGGSSESMVATIVFTNPETGFVHEPRWYSVGDVARWTLAEDGKKVMGNGANPRLSKSSGFYALLESLVKAGVPKDYFGDDVTKLVGVVAEWDTSEAKPNLVLANMLYEMPGQGSASDTPAEKAAAAGDRAMLVKRGIALVEQLVASGSATRQELQTKVFGIPDITQPDKAQLLNLIMTEEFTSQLSSSTGITLEGEEFVAPTT